MQKFVIVLFVVGIAACTNNNQSNEKPPSVTDSLTVNDTTAQPAGGLDRDSLASISVTETDSITVMNLSRQVLQSIKNRNYTKLAALFHPTKGVRFSPFAYVDTTKQRVFSSQHFQQFAISNQKLMWGEQDGSGDSILLTIPAYFKEFVYDVDYLGAPRRSVNRVLGAGNSLNNLQDVYPSATVTEFYFPGFKPEFEGMDWKTIRLVFEKHEGALFLVGVINDQWTI